MDNSLHEVFLRLMLTNGIGARTALNLFRTIQNNSENYEYIFNFPASLGVRLTKQQCNALNILPINFKEYVEKHNAWLAQSEQHHFITILDDNYPKQLLDLPDAPIALYIKAQAQNLTQLSQISIAMVGSRKATHNGLDTAFNFAGELAEQGFPIISGLADGIDAKAHEGALHKHKSTIAVIGTGIDIIYPSKHKELSKNIAQYGCIVSDFLLGEAPRPANFPRRNRLIAAFCRGIIVVEANLKSGSLITARIANELGRDVFAIPNSIYSPSSKGCHALIKDGAILLERFQDVLDEWWIGDKSQPKINSAKKELKNNPKLSLDLMTTEKSSNYTSDSLEQKIISGMGYNPISIDKLSELLNVSINEIQSALFIMEMNGDIAKIDGGGLYQRGIKR